MSRCWLCESAAWDTHNFDVGFGEVGVCDRCILASPSPDALHTAMLEKYYKPIRQAEARKQELANRRFGVAAGRAGILVKARTG